LDIFSGNEGAKIATAFASHGLSRRKTKTEKKNSKEPLREEKNRIRSKHQRARIKPDLNETVDIEKDGNGHQR